MHKNTHLLLLTALCAALTLTLPTGARAQKSNALSLGIAPSLTSPVENDITKGYVTAQVTWQQGILSLESTALSLIAGPEFAISVPHYTENAHCTYGLYAGLQFRFGRMCVEPFASFGLLSRDKALRVYQSEGVRIGIRAGRFTIFADSRWQKESYNWTNHAPIGNPSRLNFGVGLRYDIAVFR